jgi:hypothetical protein
MKMILSVVGVLSVGIRLVACPPDGPCPELDPDPDHNSSDPAFVVTPVINLAELAKKREAFLREVNIGNHRDPRTELGKGEFAAWEELDRTMHGNPSAAYAQAIETWKSNCSQAMKKLVVLRAAQIVRDTEQKEDLSFMSRSLEDLNGERTECVRLARGNGLEKKLATRRLALLESNPGLSTR